MSISHDLTRYRTFLLTLWEEGSRDGGSPPVWRFRLEDPRTGQQRGFASLEALVEALQQVMADRDEEKDEYTVSEPSDRHGGA
jgi:hypothetical protein